MSDRSKSPPPRDRSKSPPRDRSKSPPRDRSKSPPRDRSKSPPRDRSRSRSPRRSRSRSPPRRGGRSYSRSRSRSPPRGNANPESINKLFVASLSFDTRDRDLEDAFAKFGRIEECVVATDRDSGRSRGFAFVTFEDPKDAADALRDMDGTDFDGRRISVVYSRPRGDKGKGKGYGGGGGGWGGERGFNGHEVRPGDWECPACGKNVFASKTACFSCGEPKPKNLGGGGGGYDRGGGGYDRGGGGYDRGGRDYDRGGRDYDRGYDRDRY